MKAKQNIILAFVPLMTLVVVPAGGGALRPTWKLIEMLVDVKATGSGQA